MQGLHSIRAACESSKHQEGEPYEVGKTNLITNVAGLSIGQSESKRIKTGVSVVVGETPMVAGVLVMGGASGPRETDLLAPDKSVQAVNSN